ncbi:hypothetical protein L9F63_005683 [Diploptera punctata]|uniref:Uncharacterized protein n=1 Tax=Diploptera punctata TaxID=6984 RepID=A0AAD7ZD36_DIPPU|nr:hypothetical protein L9F63_005683 [Diploptera punctata]
MAIKSMEGENGEAKAKQMSVPELQDDRYFTATPTTTESRTDYDVNTSQLDSSGLEDVPLKKESRKKKLQEMADQQAQARGFQQRLRSQAGRIRSKLRSMPKPNIKLPERPKFNLPERPKFNLPERPKFNLPERPKFHLPERPKFNLPERPKFNFPDRSKFHLPERPKFNFPERPKFSMPERPKFNLPQRPKISMPSFGMGKDRKDKPRFSSTRRPLRDRSNVSSASTASSSKKNLFDFDFKSYPRIFDRKSRRTDYATSSPKPSRGQTPPPQMPSRKKGRWLQRFTELKHGDDTPVPSASEGQSRVTDEIEAEQFRDDIEMVEGAESVGGRSESTSAFRDKDYGYAVTMDDTDRPPEDERRRMEASSSSVGEARSSGSSSLRHRAGVLEEIDSDEFFLREKGLSQEDVEVGRYLTSEIREAFRAPVSALSQMDNFEYYDDEEDVENLGQQYRSTPERGPTRPARTRSLRTRKRSSKSKEKSPAEEEEEDSSQFFNTFPPTRPKRIRKTQQQQQEENEEEKESKDGRGYEQDMEEDELGETEIRKIPSFTLTDEDGKFRQQSFEEDGKLRQQSFEEVGKFREQSFEEDSKFRQQSLDEDDKFRQQSFEEEEKFRQQSLDEDEKYRQHTLHDDERFRQQSLEEPETEDRWHTEEHAVADLEPPMPPKRLRRHRKEPIPDTLCNGHYTKEDWLENLEANIVPTEEVMAMRMEPDYIIPAAPPEDFELPPEPPRRGRRKSSRATSLADEDRTSRGASSLPSERDHATDDLPVDLSLPEIPGYASVEKPTTKPRRKTSRPSAPGRRKRSTNGHSRSYPHFYSLPHRSTPIRPLRNYSTLGPSRPPRRHKALPPVDIDQKSESYIEIDDDMMEPFSNIEESHGSTRDLQSGDIIERMKGRPLPPPPRPPRKGRETRETFEDEIEDIPDGEAPLFKDDEMEEIFGDTEEKPLGALSDKVFYAQSGVTSMDDEELEEEELPKEEIEESPVELELEEKEASPVLSEKERKEPSPLLQETEIEEISVGIQTDPLPEDVCVITGDEDVSISYATVSTETTGLEPSPPRMFEFGQQTIPVRPPTPPEPTVIEKPIPYYVMPDPDTEVELKASKLQVSELDVERLNVGELQAQKITVSDIDGMSLQVAELTSRSGNLVVSGLELPPGFLQELYDSLPIPTPPPLSQTVQVQSIPPVPPASAPISPQHPAPSESKVQSQPTSEAVPESTSTSESAPVSKTSEKPTEPVVTTEVPVESVSSPEVSQSPESDSKTSSQAPTESSPVQPTFVSSVKTPSSPAPPVQTRPAPPPPPPPPPPPQQVHSIPIQQSIPLHYPNIVTGIDGLPSYIPEYMSSQVPVSLRIPSRTRSHLSQVQREMESEEEIVGLMHTPSRRRRHHVSKPVARYSSDEEEEEEYSSYRPPSRRHHSSSRGTEPSVSELSRQLLHACQGVTMRALNQLVQYVTVREGEEKRRDLQIVLCVLLLLVAGLILMGFGSGKTYHTHHWDYQFPPKP